MGLMGMTEAGEHLGELRSGCKNRLGRMAGGVWGSWNQDPWRAWSTEVT